ncbi:MAG TPA: RNA polymerase sigma factor [Polyangia bacterium]|jgi:RNA polymerase sigma-70 factor (ECF subfamily)
MKAMNDGETQRRLMELLAPLHDRARMTARRLCRSHADGDDLFHEAVLRALDHLDELRDADRFRSWFYALLINVHRARHRVSFWRRLVPLDEVRAEVAVTDGGRDAYEGAQRMARALATLAPAEREAIVLFELEGFSLEEIAALQKSSLSAVKSRLVRARGRLRRHYERRERVARPVVQEQES